MPVARATWRASTLVAVLACELGAGAALALRLQASEPPAAAAQALPVAGLQSRPAPVRPERADARTEAVRALLDRRARAVLHRDRAAFLATVDPRSTTFLGRQRALFEALRDVPLSAWSYVVHPADAEPDDPRLARRYDTWWSPRVTLRHGLRGIDRDPAESTQHLTFTCREGRWYVAADDDFAARGDSTDRQLWDGGRVVVVRGRSSLVLGHPGEPAQLRRLAADVDAAVPRVSAVWGGGWRKRVAVVVPAGQRELGSLVHTDGSLSLIAALAVAGPVRGGAGRGGDRVLVNPPNLARLGPVGRRVVLTHEVTHVASRAATGPLVPSWLAEGLADHVGYLGAGVPRRLAAQELAKDVRAGHVLARLPTDADFDGDDPDLAQAYEQAWLAVEQLVATYGQPRVLAFYRALGARRTGSQAAALDSVLREQLGTSTRDVTAAWRTSLRRTLA